MVVLTAKGLVDAELGSEVLSEAQETQDHAGAGLGREEAGDP